MTTKKLLTFFLFLALVASQATIGPDAQAAPQLLRSADFGTVYYLDDEGVRHPFPHQTTYESWYGNNFSKLVTVSNDYLAQYPLGRNITIRPGTRLVKVRTSPEVYVVTIGGVLRQLAEEELAQEFFGPHWATRVVDVPDVFFGDYTLGSPIEAVTDLPDGSVIEHPVTHTLYYLERNIFQPFANSDALHANGFSDNDLITSDRIRYTRTRPIAGFDPTIFSPAGQPLVKNADCAVQNLRAAVILLTAGGIHPEDVANVEAIKAKISERWNWASYGLSSLDVSYPTVVLQDDGQLLQRRNDGSYEVLNETLNTFYEQHADQFDFVLIWTDFRVPRADENEIAHYLRVTNRLNGIGINRMSAGEIYGSGGKLKGIAVMGELDQYDTATELGMSQALNIVSHELLHQWGAATTFIDDQGKSSQALLRAPDLGHWSYYAGWLSPLGGSGWQDNGDGTFTSLLSQLPDPNLRRFSRLDLYLMGLIPYQLTEPFFYVEPTTPGAQGNTIAGTAVAVDVEQIISDIGEIGCVD